MTTLANLPHDDTSTQQLRFDGTRGKRYTEVILIAPEPSGGMTGGIYNTIGLNDPSGAGDSSPSDAMESLDMALLAKEFEVPADYLIGLRLWCLDWLDVVVGAERTFGGLTARWVMWLDVPPALLSHESNAYQPMTGNRDTSFGINAGSPAFIPDDPEGNAWVMKSASMIIDPGQTFESLEDLGTDCCQPTAGRSGPLNS